MLGDAPAAQGASPSPQPILRLPLDVVNRVAAGEVIHRPSSALKELLENSLDAGATSVQVTVRDGGNALLQVADNGCGVREEDLGLLCERHATSKIRTYEDLAAVATFGFRGEALASISFVSRLSVTTMRAGAQCALRCSYRDGVLEGPPKACAGVKGTTVTVEDLFYNVPTRRRALRPPGEEYAKVLEVVQRYALLRTDVAFTVRKHGEKGADLQLPAPAGLTVVDRVRAVFGAALAKELVPFSAEVQAGDSGPSFSLTGLASGPANPPKRGAFILFINGRLVDSPPLRRALEAAYTPLQQKQADKPWLYLALRLPAGHVDVNVHPTKSEVAFLHAEDVAVSAAGALGAALEAANTVRTFAPGAATQPTAPPRSAPTASRPSAGEAGGGGSTQRERAGGDHKLVRTDARAATLDAFTQRDETGRSTLVLGRGAGAGLEAVRAAARARRGSSPPAPAPEAGPSRLGLRPHGSSPACASCWRRRRRAVTRAWAQCCDDTPLWGWPTRWWRCCSTAPGCMRRTWAAWARSCSGSAPLCASAVPRR